MKKIILILLLFVSHLAKSQALIGYTPSGVRSKFPDKEWEYGKWGEKNNLLVMSYSNGEIICGYFF